MCARTCLCRHASAQTVVANDLRPAWVSSLIEASHAQWQLGVAKQPSCGCDPQPFVNPSPEPQVPRGAFAQIRHSRVVATAWRTPGRRALLGTLIGSAPGFLLPFAVTTRFGAGRITDAYFFAFSIATFVSAVYEGVLQANATPVLQSEKTGGRPYFLAGVRRILMQSTVAAGITYLVFGGILAATAVSGRTNWTPTERHTCLVLMAYFTFYVVGSAATAVLASGLYALEEFFFPIASMALRSVVPLAGLAVFRRDPSGIELFGILMCVGEGVRAVLLCTRLLFRSRSLRDGVPRATVGVWATGIPHALSMVAAVANPVIDRLIAAPLGPGSVTVLELGEKVFYAPLMALTSLFSIVAGVRWASHTLAGGRALSADFRRTLLRALALASLIAVAVIGAALAVRLAAGEEVSGAPTGELTAVIIFLLIGLPAGVVISLGARLLTATRRTRVLPLFAALALILNVLGDLVGVHLLGIRGIALASTLMRCGNALLYVLVCRRMLQADRFLSMPVEQPAPVSAHDHAHDGSTVTGDTVSDR